MAKSPLQRTPLLTALLAAWGVIANKDLVLDTSGIGQIFGFSEVVLLVTSYESHPIVREMTRVSTAFPLARSLDLKTGGQDGRLRSCFRTSENSFATTKLERRRKFRSIQPRTRKGPLTLGVAAFEWIRAELWWSAPQVGWEACYRFNGNRDLFLNMINWLSSDEELISIRPKDPEDRRLALNRRQMKMIFYTSVLLLPLAVIGAGISVWWKRR